MQPSIREMLDLRRPPIAIGFLDELPVDLPRWGGPELPGGLFFLARGDERTCLLYGASGPLQLCCGLSYPSHRPAVGASPGAGWNDRTHDPEGLPRHVGGTRDSTVGGLTRRGRVSTGRRRNSPDVVLLTVTAVQGMIVNEAVLRAGIGGAVASTLGRPSCAVLPLTMDTRQAAISLGCQGNRTFTGLADDEMYVSIPGEHWSNFVQQVAEIRQANEAMASTTWPDERHSRACNC